MSEHFLHSSALCQVLILLTLFYADSDTKARLPTARLSVHWG